MFSYWSNPPAPFLDGWRFSPVPGWGSNPRVAGPARVGVGADVTIDPSLFRRAMMVAKVPGSEEDVAPVELTTDEDKPFPWLYVVAGTLVVGAGAAFAYNMGWIKV
jgi:hypothetical protein